jgi:hypothetical protein
MFEKSNDEIPGSISQPVAEIQSKQAGIFVELLLAGGPPKFCTNDSLPDG